ncbi:hypothetical protein EB118_05095 [bacterium]|nr:hypothetical protein [bacterium]NBX98615.1 hypothetical protein [bacterium]NDC94249.1 hypothetical protein [bacterium]NDD84591.1 hypothetical protein [bacterium]NDG29460.1 hypothetical protein [bacterium]
MPQITSATKNQQLFTDILIGTLLYSVVLGFFNDYTNILTTKSYSTTFLAALVLQLLTLATLHLKDTVKQWFRGKKGKVYKIGLVLSVWLILFLSKFVFLEAIDFVFGNNVQITGFFGLMAMIISMLAANTALDYGYKRFGKE